ncbi:hypothetical protein [Flavobacterium piscisymbiosum]|uniref:Lipoprotein n=1 Tax=Flavobacterium piscisymbiosum TaxID=2893753 RepID=A0ABS8MKB2_9FLAO|nr:hypothetical protein [Flavobacterium sp. F-30]MCC9065938.1 hypothetical protein [Flavobacterium sp. F-30]
MYREIKRLSLISVSFILFSCNTKKENAKEYTDFKLIRGLQMRKNDAYTYSKKCFLYYANYKFLIEESFKYEKGLLKEYVYCSPEGPDVRDYNKETYSKDKLEFSKQTIKNYDNEIVFNSEKYKIDKIINDSIIATKRDETIIVIIENKNEE